MKKKIPGILALTSVLITVIVGVLTGLSGEFFSAFNAQLLIVLFTLSIALTGIYVLNAYCPETKRNIKLAIGAFGLGLTAFSVLVAFNSIDFLTTYNWLITGGILYVLLVQLQVLNWGKAQSFITKLMSIILILSNLFLAIYFMANWQYSGIALWIDIAMFTALGSFILGLILTKKRTPETPSVTTD